jgi:triosephosphate isomerase
MRKPLVAGNWKMHGSREMVAMLLAGIKQGAAGMTNIDIAVFPSFVYLSETENLLKNSPIVWGAQNNYPGLSGAFTGEIACAMLVEYGCKYVLVGHSERRTILHEDLPLINAKFQTTVAAQLIPILCVGETEAEHEKNQTETVITAQLEPVITAARNENFSEIVIAYEPVWAIGTGKTATPEQAQEVHAFIRQLLSTVNSALANRTRILYGGSVKADNAAGLFAMADIDGALVGGASLDAKGFLAICQAAATRITQ